MKNRKVSLLTLIVLLALAILVTFQLTYIRVNNKYQKALNELKDTQILYDKLSALDSTFRDNYIGEIDEKKLTDAMLRGYVAGTGDKYGAYYTKDEFEELILDSNAELNGVGISVIYNSEYQGISIINVMPGSPALESGILPGDIIMYVEGKPVSELGYSIALSMLRGEEGTVAKFSVLRDTALMDFEVERRKITEYTVYERVYSHDEKIGVVQIVEFDDGTPVQFKAAVNNLLEKGVESIVFDVRNNPGGNLEAIKSVLDFLLPEGVIIRTYDAKGNEESFSSDANFINCDMMVLVNGNTASAAELFASALRDYEKVKLVGETTWGKGTMQSIIQLYDGSAISVSQKMYCPPISENYEGVGIVPDIEVKLDANTSVFLLNDDNDPQLAAAIKELQANNK